MKSPALSLQNITDWSTDRAFRSVMFGLHLLPFEKRIAISERMIGSLVRNVTSFERRARTHIADALPQVSSTEQTLIARNSINNFVRTLTELYAGQEFTDRCINYEVTGPGLPVIEQATREKRPILFITGHFGNHEAPRHALTKYDLKIGGLYRPMKNPYFNSHYAATMQNVSGPVFAQGRRGTAAFTKHLSAGGMATLLFDVWVDGGYKINFMGRPAATSLSAAKFALKYDALLVPYFGTRRADNIHFDIEIEAPITPSTPEQMMTEATLRLEQRIRTNPEQYFWVHRRWKI